MTDLKKLREMAEKATPGPWKCAGGIYVYSGDTMVADNNDETALVRARGVGGGMSREQQEANVEFVSAANPETVIALLDRIEKLEAQLKEANEVAEFYGDEKNWMTTRKDELHEARMTIAQDAESFGYQRDEYSPNIVQLIGGKMARELLRRWDVK